MQSLKDRIYMPFMNVTVFWLVNWFYSGLNLKSAGKLDQLVKKVILADDFDYKHLCKFDTKKEFSQLNDNGPKSPMFTAESG